MPERMAKTDAFKPIADHVGSGPFRFLTNEFVAGSSAAYARNDAYVPRQEAPDWFTGAKIVNFPRVEWKIIPDSGTPAPRPSSSTPPTSTPSGHWVTSPSTC